MTRSALPSRYWLKSRKKHIEKETVSMVTYEEFKEIMKERAEEEIGARAVVRYFKKLNGTGFEGLVIMSSDTNVSPVIYLKGYYSMYLEIMDEEAAIDSIWKDIKKCYFDNLPVSSFDVEGFFDYEKIRSNLGLRLVNYKSNEEWLRDISHIRFLDFAIVFTVRVMEEMRKRQLQCIVCISINGKRVMRRCFMMQ
jgi:hypothetical protein